MKPIIPDDKPLAIASATTPPNTNSYGYTTQYSEQEVEAATILLNRLVDHAQRGRLETGEATVSWKARGIERLEDYVNNGFPWHARQDEDQFVSSTAILVLGSIKGWWFSPSRIGHSSITSLQVHVVNILIGTYNSGVHRTAEELDAEMWKADKDHFRFPKKPVRPPRALRADYPNASNNAWFAFAATRVEHGLPYSVRLGSPFLEGPKYSDNRRRRDYLAAKKWISADAFFDSAFEGQSGYFLRYPSVCVPDLRAPGYCEPLRKAACDKHGYDVPAMENDEVGYIRSRYIIHRGVTPEDRYCDLVNVRFAAVRKWGVAPDHVNDGYWRIKLRHRMKFGFLPEERANPKTIDPHLQGLYLRVHGVDSPWWTTTGSSMTDEVQARITRCLASTGIAAGVKTVDICDLILRKGDDPKTVEAVGDIFGRKVHYGNSWEEYRGFWLVTAFETLAAHPEFMQEMELYIGCLSPEDRRKKSFLAASSWIQQNAEGILAARERRLMGLGLSGELRKKEASDGSD